MSVSSLDTSQASAGQEEQNDLRKVGAHPDYWYPLLSSHKLKKGKAIGVTFAGEPIVLVRSASGEIYALEDRCVLDLPKLLQPGDVLVFKPCPFGAE